MRYKVRALSTVFAIVGLYLLVTSATSCDVVRPAPTPALTATPAPALTPTLSPVPIQTPVLEIPPQIHSARDALLVFFRNKYPDKVPADGVVWIGRDTTPPGLVGVSTYEFTGDGWWMTVAALATSPTEILYEMGLDHAQTGLRWTGRFDASYQLLESNLNVAVEVLVVREIVLTYVREHYAGGAPAPDLVWIGERTTRSRVLGRETCQFTSSGATGTVADPWTMTVEYDLVNPELVMYEVDLRHAGTGFLWRGQVNAEGTVLEHR